MRKFPMPQDYQQAMQIPRLSLLDNKLREGTVEVDKMGLPRVRSGNFASVYRISTGQAHFAIKCFLSAPDDIQTRWGHISNYLDRINCAYFIKVEYIARGIGVNGQPLPILKMPWQDGIPIDRYLHRCLTSRDTQGTAALTGQFLDLYKTLRLHHIAHGDLQHGNILITPEQSLVLIDYDGLYCPDMTSGGSHETGHPNYQHPKRQSRHYNEHLDSFSAIVIFTAISALTYDLDLWGKYYNGDNLLFCGRDFLNTNQSPLFRALSASGDTRIRHLASAIAESCLSPYENLPDFLPLLEEIHSAAGADHAPLSTLSEPTAQLNVPAQVPLESGREPEKPMNWISAAFAGMTDSKISTDMAVAKDSEGLTRQPQLELHGHWQGKVVCPRCDALNDQSTALCVSCGFILSIPIEHAKPSKPPLPPSTATAQGIPFLAKLKWGLLYFILFFLVMAAYDQTDNNYAIVQRALALFEAGKNRLFAKRLKLNGEIEQYSKTIAASPLDPDVYLKRGDAYMKAGRVDEAAGDYKTAAKLSINTAPFKSDNSSNYAADTRR
ncbi:MAG: hypothetical protein HQK97_11105 [Nitrospirae bacterium]|nr:hypothetical protein [Nitrospirota bacterium]